MSTDAQIISEVVKPELTAPSVQTREKELQKFGLVVGSAIIVIFGTIFPVLKHGLNVEKIPRIPWALGLALMSLALVRPRALDFFERMWMTVGMKLAKVNTKVLLFALYWVLIVPVAAMCRLFGKNPVDQQNVKQGQSYRVRSVRFRSPTQFEKPF